MKGLLIAFTLVAFNASAALTDISPIGIVDLIESSEPKTEAVAEKPVLPEAKADVKAEVKEEVKEVATATAAPSEVDGKAIYEQSCFPCHGIGVAGAPKLADAVAWAPRIATGMDALLNTVLTGKGAMPPKGGNMSLSEEQIKAAISFMVESSK